MCSRGFVALGARPDMLQKLVALRLITPPAIWGKLAGHSDFVRSGMRHGESEGWQPWLIENGRFPEVGPVGTLPTAFVLAPGTLGFAPHHFVVGVVAPSIDRVGRRHALLVYQVAHPRWAERHFAAQAIHPQDWLFWLGRAVARHIGPHGAPQVQALGRTVDALWRLHAPGRRELFGARADSTAGSTNADPSRDRSKAVLDRFAGPCIEDDLAARLQGVRYFPWSNWPHAFLASRVQNAFWQQDAAGGFVNAAPQLSNLWSSSQ